MHLTPLICGSQLGLINGVQGKYWFLRDGSHAGQRERSESSLDGFIPDYSNDPSKEGFMGHRQGSSYAYMHNREEGLENWKLEEGRNMISFDPCTWQTYGNSP